MSYCRWSSDDFTCDVYVYESNEGFVIHVAANKRTWHVELPPHYTWEEGEFNFDQWYSRHQAVSALMDDEANFTIAKIGLPHDGETFVLDTPGEAARQLRELRDMGYQVPDYPISALQEEQDDIG